MGRRRYPFVDEQVQAFIDRVGEERGKLCRDVTYCLYADHIQSGRTLRIASNMGGQRGLSLFVVFIPHKQRVAIFHNNIEGYLCTCVIL